jgi:hypothetical protein
MTGRLSLSHCCERPGSPIRDARSGRASIVCERGARALASPRPSGSQRLVGQGARCSSKAGASDPAAAAPARGGKALARGFLGPCDVAVGGSGDRRSLIQVVRNWRALWRVRRGLAGAADSPVFRVGGDCITEVAGCMCVASRARNRAASEASALVCPAALVPRAFSCSCARVRGWCVARERRSQGLVGSEAWRYARRHAPV